MELPLKRIHRTRLALVLCPSTSQAPHKTKIGKAKEKSIHYKFSAFLGRYGVCFCRRNFFL
jgi:hypothetical protein